MLAVLHSLTVSSARGDHSELDASCCQNQGNKRVDEGYRA